MAAVTRPAGIDLWPRDGAWTQYIERAASGDEEALAGLYDESGGLVYSTALRILGNEADAEEVTLEVYSQVWRCAPDFDRNRGAAGAWLAMLARSRAIDRLRSGAARRAKEREMPESRDFSDPGILPDEAGAASEQRRMIQAALGALSPEQREIVELAYFSGLSHSELAARLGQPLGTVKTRIRLAMMRLRKLLEPLL
jgi:RNA polymerase sigma-70 factor (ECF subfamily)